VIMFQVKEAREYLLKHGKLYTLRALTMLKEFPENIKLIGDAS